MHSSPGTLPIVDIPVIDIHPHIIAGDSDRYPRAPLGGQQSAWSQERPVGVEQLIVEQDRAGIRKAALVQASTCYGHDNSYVADAVEAYPDAVHRCLLVRHPGTRCVRHDGALDGPRADGLEALHHRQHHAGSGGLAGRSALVPRVAQGRGGAPPGLPADDGGQAFRSWSTCSQRFPGLRVVLDHLARPAQEDGPPYTAADSLWGLARFPGVYVKVTERNFLGAKAGKATPETFFGRLVSEFGASRIAWGSNFPASERSLPELLALARGRASASCRQADREWIFSRTAQTLYPALANHQ